MSDNPTAAEGLAACPNPWCHPSPILGPTFIWKTAEAALVECHSCGLQGPIFSPVIRNDDGEQVGVQDAEAEAIAAWNRHPIPAGDDLVEVVARAIHAVRFEDNDDPYDDERGMARAALTAIGPRAGEVERLREAVDRLQTSEAAYRHCHDVYGASDSRTGRAWDLLRRAGNDARTARALTQKAGAQ